MLGLDPDERYRRAPAQTFVGDLLRIVISRTRLSMAGSSELGAQERSSAKR